MSIGEVKLNQYLDLHRSKMINNRTEKKGEGGYPPFLKLKMPSRCYSATYLTVEEADSQVFQTLLNFFSHPGETYVSL